MYGWTSNERDWAKTKWNVLLLNTIICIVNRYRHGENMGLVITRQRRDQRNYILQAAKE